MSRDHREQVSAQRILVTCSRCGKPGFFDRSDYVHVHVPAFRHRFVAATPTEEEQDRLEAQHRIDYGPMPEPGGDPVLDDLDDDGGEEQVV